MTDRSHWRLQRFALILSIVGIGGVLVTSLVPYAANVGIPLQLAGGLALVLNAASIPGLLLSIVSNLLMPSRIAECGGVLGLVGCWNIPTLLFAVFHQ
jgi:hypothetical protein